MTMHKALHSRDDVDRLHVPGKKKVNDLPALKTVFTKQYSDLKTTYKSMEED